MLHLLQTNICRENSTSNSRNLSENLQRNGNLRTEERVKIEHITNDDRIAYIKIGDDMTSAKSVKSKPHKQTIFHKYFFQKYPDFFRHYCLCLHRKIEPDDDDPNTVTILSDDKYGANSFLLNRTPIIPITIDPKKYVIF